MRPRPPPGDAHSQGLKPGSRREGSRWGRRTQAATSHAGSRAAGRAAARRSHAPRRWSVPAGGATGPGAGGEAVGGPSALCSPLPFVLLGWLPPHHTSAQALPQSRSAVGSTTQQGPSPRTPHSLLTAPIYAAPAGKAVPGPRRQLFLKDRYFRPGPARRGLFGGRFPFLANPVSCVYPAGPRRKPPRRPREGQSRRVPGCGEGLAWVPSGVSGKGWWARRGVGLWTR